jgi:cytoskeletal protein RodZ
MCEVLRKVLFGIVLFFIYIFIGICNFIFYIPMKMRRKYTKCVLVDPSEDKSTIPDTEASCEKSTIPDTEASDEKSNIPDTEASDEKSTTPDTEIGDEKKPTS